MKAAPDACGEAPDEGLAGCYEERLKIANQKGYAVLVNEVDND